MRRRLRFLRRLAGCFLVLAACQSHSAHAQDVEQQAVTCVACHPKSGVPADPSAPIIWGQNEGYLYLQLRDFKHRMRAAERDAAMNALTQTMTDAQMQAIAKYVSAQPWPKLDNATTPPTDPLVARGAKLAALGACGGCHFNGWQGYSANPRLRGQTSAYLAATIEDFRSGERANSPGMSDLLRIYSPDEITAIVAYLSSLE